MCCTSHAQKYKPLETVEVPSNYYTEIRINQMSYMTGETYYMVSHRLGTRYMTADFAVPANCSMTMQLLPGITQGMDAVLSVGGVNYYLSVTFVIDETFYIDLMEDHIRHIAVSGLQSITFLDYGSTVNVIEFHVSEQELWRRTAEELGKAAYIIR